MKNAEPCWSSKKLVFWTNSHRGHLFFFVLGSARLFWFIIRSFTVRVDGRKRKFSNTMMSWFKYVIHYKHNACSVGDAIVFPSFWRFRVDGRKRFEYAACGRVFFTSGEKNTLRFQAKNILSSRPSHELRMWRMWCVINWVKLISLDFPRVE